MPTVCIQCAMRALVAGEPSPVFEESPDAHQARVHPNPYETYRERQMLEAKLFAAGLIPADPEGPSEPKQ